MCSYRRMRGLVSEEMRDAKLLCFLLVNNMQNIILCRILLFYAILCVSVH